jgi:hypothetical protein
VNEEALAHERGGGCRARNKHFLAVNCIIILKSFSDNKETRFRDVAVLLQVGAAGLPIIYFHNNFYLLSKKIRSSIFKYLTFDKMTQG